jgi:hypothetical protein
MPGHLDLRDDNIASNDFSPKMASTAASWLSKTRARPLISRLIHQRRRLDDTAVKRLACCEMQPGTIEIEFVETTILREGYLPARRPGRQKNSCADVVSGPRPAFDGFRIF